MNVPHLLKKDNIASRRCSQEKKQEKRLEGFMSDIWLNQSKFEITLLQFLTTFIFLRKLNSLTIQSTESVSFPLKNENPKR